MVEIKEHKRDNSLDYIRVLEAVRDIPFSVGKNLLIDFLYGDLKNSSITDNNLDDVRGFGSLRESKDEIRKLIDNLIINGLIEVVGSDMNRFWKIMKLTPKGRDEIFKPVLNDKKLKSKINFESDTITDIDRKAFFELGSFLSEYNDEQKKAIIYDKDKILCIAGAGSGKTTVLTKRAEFLVKYKGVDNKKILAITFTRKAKNEMEERLLKNNVHIQVETFNSFCEKILKLYGNKIYGKPTRVIGYMERVMAVMEALSHQGVDLDIAVDKYFSQMQKRNKTKEQLYNSFINDCFFILDYFKSKNNDIYDFSKDALYERDSAMMIYKICVYLKEYMNAQGLRDYTDQVIDVLAFFKNHPEVIPQYDHLLIDEYQDVNAMQIELIDLLNAKNLFCVGDPRQSIYGWRGSDINYIMEFSKKYPKSGMLILRKNYRSGKNIVNFMNNSIKDIGLPDLDYFKEGDSDIKLLEFDSESGEFEFVIQKIMSSEVAREEIFVLARTNRQLNELSQIMKLRGIKHILKTDEINRPVFAQKNEVTLATIHAIKGLEAKMVFVLGCNEVNFPSKVSDHPVIEMVKIDEYDKEEEEKRLFYVAISRAKEKLYLTYSGKKPTYFINDSMLDIMKK